MTPDAVGDDFVGIVSVHRLQPPLQHREFRRSVCYGDETETGHSTDRSSQRANADHFKDVQALVVRRDRLIDEEVAVKGKHPLASR